MLKQATGHERNGQIRFTYKTLHISRNVQGNIFVRLNTYSLYSCLGSFRVSSNMLCLFRRACPPRFKRLSEKIPFRDGTRSGRVTAYTHAQSLAHDTLKARTHLRSFGRLLQGGMISDVHHQVLALLVLAISVHADVVMRQPVSLISRVHLLTQTSSVHPMTHR